MEDRPVHVVNIHMLVGVNSVSRHTKALGHYMPMIEVGHTANSIQGG